MEAATARFRPPAGTRISGALYRLASDRRLIERYCAGDDTAFAALHERHRARVLAICMGVLGAKEDAEDAAQEAFASAAAQLRCRPPNEFRPWIARVARNAAIDAVRARRASSELDEHVAGGVEPSADLAARGEFEELMSGLRTLPESQRTALVLRELAGYSYLEIGTTMELDETAVRGLIARARIGLRQHLEAQNVECLQIRERLAAELDGRRRPSEVRRHLRTCSGCREFRRAARSDARALRGLVPLPLGLFGILGSLAAVRTPTGAIVGAGLLAKTSAGTKAVSVGVACAVSICTVEGARELGATSLPDIPAGIVGAAEDATGVSHSPRTKAAAAGPIVSPVGQHIAHRQRRASLAAPGAAVPGSDRAVRGRRTGGKADRGVAPADTVRGHDHRRRDGASRRYDEAAYPLGAERRGRRHGGGGNLGDEAGDGARHGGGRRGDSAPRNAYEGDRRGPGRTAGVGTGALPEQSGGGVEPYRPPRSGPGDGQFGDSGGHRHAGSVGTGSGGPGSGGEVSQPSGRAGAQTPTTGPVSEPLAAPQPAG